MGCTNLSGSRLQPALPESRYWLVHSLSERDPSQTAGAMIAFRPPTVQAFNDCRKCDVAGGVPVTAHRRQPSGSSDTVVVVSYEYRPRSVRKIAKPTTGELKMNYRASQHRASNCFGASSGSALPNSTYSTWGLCTRLSVSKTESTALVGSIRSPTALRTLAPIPLTARCHSS